MKYARMIALAAMLSFGSVVMAQETPAVPPAAEEGTDWGWIGLLGLLGLAGLLGRRDGTRTLNR